MRNNEFAISIDLERFNCKIVLVSFGFARFRFVSFRFVEYNKPEKRLRIEIASIKQMIDRGEVAHVKWINAEFQIADSLTKRGASNAKLLHAMESGHLKSY